MPSPGQALRLPLLLIAACTSGACRAPALDADGRPPGTELAYHAGVWLGDGEPANDLPVPGALSVRQRVAEDWWVRLGLEHAAGDFETPHELAGIAQDPDEGAIDADASYLSLLAWIERVYAPTDADELLWQVGAGVSSVDVDDASGPTAGGGTFDVETDAGTELLGSLGVGYRRRFGRWVAEALVRYDLHLADWEVEDRVSGATGDLGSYGTWALLLGLGFGF